MGSVNAMDVLVAAAPRAGALPRDRVAVALEGLYDAGRAAWPTVPLRAEAFARRLAFAVRDRADVLAAMQELHGADFFLAAACVAGTPGATDLVIRAHGDRIGSWVARTYR